MKQALVNTWKIYKKSLPIMLGILMLINLFNPFIQKYYNNIFTGNSILDPLIGALAGSISFGIPITSYIVGGELLNKGISLLSVSAFIMAWTTVGFAMLPIEIAYLGKKFSIYRNLINFVFSIIISVLTVFTINILK